jgi:CRISPR-associated protein Csm4
VSSAFPFQGETLFLPKPHSDQIFRQVANKQLKKARKIAYLSVADFQRVGKGEKLDFAEPKATGQYYTEEEVRIKSDVSQRVALPRMLDSDARTFYMERLYFGEGAGLYFMAEYPTDEANKSKFDSALRLLGEQGIGTDRNTGNGFFETEATTLLLDLPTENHATHYLNVSPFCPASEADMQKINLDESYFSLTKRGGWIASPENENDMSLRKKSVYMFAEGSVFRAGEPPKGTITNLQPAGFAHEIWRDGRAIFLPIKI